MATAKMEEEKDKFDWRVIQKMTLQPSHDLGFESFEIPILKWRVLDNFMEIVLQDNDSRRSKITPIKNLDLFGSMNLQYDIEARVWSLFLHLDRLANTGFKKELFPVPYFVVKSTTYDEDDTLVAEEFWFSTDVFDPNQDYQRLKFHCTGSPGMSVLEVYQDPLESQRFRSLQYKMTVGKINRTQLETKGFYKQQLSLRFSLEPEDVQMVLRFWNADLNQKMPVPTKKKTEATNGKTDSGISATLHVLNHMEHPDLNLPSFSITFTIYHPKDGQKNIVKKVVFEGLKVEYSFFLARFVDLDELMSPGEVNLFYKVVVENC